MEKYIRDEELEKIWADSFTDLYSEVFSEDTRIIDDGVIRLTKTLFKDTLTDKQKKIFDFLEENIEVFEASAIKDVFFFAYRLCMKRFIEEHSF